jgi:2-dehydro-3-deoxyphosphogluconate aldolase/(4S)-4-hydroxy-2-oxoglutarate aldolase
MSTERRQVFDRILGGGVLPIFYHAEAGTAEQMIQGCAAAGAGAIAVELRDAGQSVFADIMARSANAATATVGAGAVTDAATGFVCGAHFDEGVARLCNRRRIAYIPVCAGLSEIAAAEELGAEIVALRAVRDPDAARVLLGAAPKSTLLVIDVQAPTEERTRRWVEAGVAALGLGTETLADAMQAGGPEAVRTTVGLARRWVRRARGEKLFQGVEHVGLYEHRGASAAEITAWYRDTFEWDTEEGQAYYFAAGDGPGRIEIMKVGNTDRCHLAIKVADLEEATAYLKAKGIDLVPPETRPDGRRIFFTVTDPAGNILHLLP